MKKKKPKILKEIAKYQIPELNKDIHKSISYTQLSIYQQCPYRWKLQYKDKLQAYTPSIYTVFGKAFHETLQDYLEKMYNVSVKEADSIDLETLLLDKLKEHYTDERKNNEGIHFSTGKELAEFYDDGVAILRALKKKRSAYFNKKGWHLVGIEIPLLLFPENDYPTVAYKGFLDVVLYHEKTEEFLILDIKTSTRGWKEEVKRDVSKQNQLILYKEFFSIQFGIPADKINVKFLIVKRKIWENSEYPQSRIQEFIPTSGPIKTKKALGVIKGFLKDCFNNDGSIRNIDYPKRPSSNTCKFCPFKGNPELCQEGALME